MRKHKHENLEAFYKMYDVLSGLPLRSDFSF